MLDIIRHVIKHGVHFRRYFVFVTIDRGTVCVVALVQKVFPNAFHFTLFHGNEVAVFVNEITFTDFMAFCVDIALRLSLGGLITGANEHIRFEYLRKGQLVDCLRQFVNRVIRYVL